MSFPWPSHGAHDREEVLSDVKLPQGWSGRLRDEFESPGLQALLAGLAAERESGSRIFPRPGDWFRALELTPLAEVRVVILGQDPYHGPDQAHGLCFSVQPGTPTPGSLRNIYKELASDLGIAPAPRGCLEHWARQGVLLLNDVLTVEQGRPGSHQRRGWERFTDAVIRLVNARKEPVVFMLWGKHAQKKAAFVDGVEEGGRHLVLKAPHPSGLSAHRGFLGCRHFSRANAFLEAHRRGSIDWRLPLSPGA